MCVLGIGWHIAELLRKDKLSTNLLRRTRGPVMKSKHSRRRYSKMRRRSMPVSSEEAFITGAATEQEATTPKTVDLHRYVRPRKWPLSHENPNPSLAKGREDLKKPF